MKLYKYYLLIASAFCLFACENEMDDLSRETVPCEIVLDGAKTVLVEMGNPYIDPGYEAFQGNIDVTEDVIVSGTLDINTAGKYTLRYTVKNSDGVSTIEKRTVIVFDPVSPSGFYKVSKDSYRNAPPTKEYESEPTVLIYQEESGAYYISDLFGGFYDVGRGYGSRYAVGGAVNISRKGKIQ
ncbi:hypothetical protein AGMMS4957_17730 [Bacteroidia bacterium]|nr:hypothetical protein AGMMS4957_17730 [Bacteroidia bacterium]